MILILLRKLKPHHLWS